MKEHRILFSSFLRPRSTEVSVRAEIVLNPLVHEEGRSIASVAHRLGQSDEYVVSGTSDLDWFTENADTAHQKYGVIRPYERIVFFGAGKTRGYPTLKWDAAGRAFIPGSPIPHTFVWNSMFGLAALREKIPRKD